MIPIFLFFRVMMIDFFPERIILEKLYSIVWYSCAMTYQSQPFRLSPRSTPKIVKWTIIATLIVSFLSIISHALFTQVFHIPSLQYLFSLTTWGIHKFFIWQFLSYPFLQPFSSGQISIELIFHLFFDSYLLWSIGSAVVHTKGTKHFIGLYFGGTFFVGIIAYLSLLFFASPLPFAGARTSIYILLIGWVFLFPQVMILLFFIIPVRAKWLVFGWISINLFLDFSNGSFFSFFIGVGAIIYGYCYCIFTWESLSPFYRLHCLDKKMIYLKRKWLYRIRQMIKTQPQRGKIYHLKRAKWIMEDDDFVNACLDKISKKGKQSLTLKEHLRLWWISLKKRR